MYRLVHAHRIGLARAVLDALASVPAFQGALSSVVASLTRQTFAAAEAYVLHIAL